MTLLLIAQAAAVLGLAAGGLGILLRARETLRRKLPADRSPMKAAPVHGILYAFTLGMMPWAKESTRIHMIAYLRGIGFHVGIFGATGALLVSPFWGWIPEALRVALAAFLALTALLGAGGGVLRLADRNLRGLSTPDDHFAVWLVTLYMAVAALAVVFDAFWIPFYFVAAFTWMYVPLGKIRHCLYFFFSRIFFGRFFGRRAVLPHPQRTAPAEADR